jgi:hypothetical protein
MWKGVVRWEEGWKDVVRQEEMFYGAVRQEEMFCVVVRLKAMEGGHGRVWLGVVGVGGLTCEL